ncbi:uncharacterized protein LOC144425102 [Styela clava]
MTHEGIVQLNIDHEKFLRDLFDKYRYESPTNVDEIVNKLEDFGITGQQEFTASNYSDDETDEEEHEEPSVGCSIKQEHVHTVLSELSKHMVNSSYRNQTNLSAEMKDTLTYIKGVTEQLQQFAEVKATIQNNILNAVLAELYFRLDNRIPEDDIKFYTEWRTYNLLLLSHLAGYNNLHKLYKEINQNVITLVNEVYGQTALEKQAYGIAFHNMAIYYKSRKQYEQCLLYYEVALAVYNISSDWKNEKTKLSLSMQLEESAKTVRLMQRRQDVTEVLIGLEGGRLNVECCEVKIPRNALDQTKKFTVSSELDNASRDDMISISPILSCEPATNFKLPVKMSIPAWCGADEDYVEVQICYKPKNSSDWSLLERKDLKHICCDISFDTKHFTDFHIRVKNIFSKLLKYKMAMSVGKNTVGNYTFIAYIKNGSIRKKWKNELEATGYTAAQEQFNNIIVRNDDEIKVHFQCKSPEFKFDPATPISFTTNFTKEYFHFENFALVQTAPSTAKLTTVVCKIEHNKKEVEKNDKKSKKEIYEKKWNEELSAVPFIMDQTTSTESLIDVFKNEITKEFDSPQVWKDFAGSCSGLALSPIEIREIGNNFEKHFEKQKLEMLILWKNKIGSEDEQMLIVKIRGIVKNYRIPTTRLQNNRTS